MAVYVAIGVIVPTFLLWLLITYLWRRHIIKRHSLGKQTTKAPYSLTCVECKGKFLGSYVDTYEKQRSLAIGEGWEIYKMLTESSDEGWCPFCRELKAEAEAKGDSE